MNHAPIVALVDWTSIKESAPELLSITCSKKNSVLVVISFLVLARTYLSLLSLYLISLRHSELIKPSTSEITYVFMAERTDNDAVMTTNLTTLSEKGLKGGHRCEGVYVFYACVVVCVCVVHVVRGSKGRPGKISHLQAWDCC